jgi:EAL domain-containing protein (putative c-di-GMP-specific phosphodiesterase class I)/GGDEF domain-containing protein
MVPLDMRLSQLTDPITMLPNRQAFIDGFLPEPDSFLVMLTLADATHFNQLLRAIGHEYSEDFIREGSARLREALSPEIVIYHVSILSFAFMFPQHAAKALLRKIVLTFEKPLIIGGVPVAPDIALGTTNGAEPVAAIILRAALAAAQDCRMSGADWAHYNPRTDTAHQRGFTLLSHLPAALEASDQLSLHFQPKYAMASGAMTSAEALLRWTHPAFGNISPAEFIPLAEATAHIHALTDWVLRHAIEQASLWVRQGLKLSLAVNVSPRNLGRRGFAQRVADLLEEYGVDPRMIELEFTEGVLMSSDPILLDELRALRATNVRIALDDFGSGFANFSYLTHLPADIIKLDKSIIQEIETDERSAVVVQSLIELAHRLGYSVVAEGIEMAKTYEMLAGWGCDEAQGYFMSRPLDAAGFAEAAMPAVA